MTELSMNEWARKEQGRQETLADDTGGWQPSNTVPEANELAQVLGIWTVCVLAVAVWTNVVFLMCQFRSISEDYCNVVDFFLSSIDMHLLSQVLCVMTTMAFQITDYIQITYDRKSPSSKRAPTRSQQVALSKL
jgi:hypothetical protein